MGAAIGQQKGGIPRPLPALRMKDKAPDWYTLTVLLRNGILRLLFLAYPQI